MSEPNSAEDHLRTLMKLWVKTSEKKQYHEALLFAFIGYLASRESEDIDTAHSFLAPINSATLHLLQPLADKYVEERAEQTSCSFCGRGKPEVKLGAGPSVYICDSCVSSCSEIFKDNK